MIAQHAEKPFILGYRLSPEELEQPGISLADTLQFVEVLSGLNLDYIHVSMGNVWRTSMLDQNDTVPTIEHIRKQINGRTALIGVGSIITPDDAEKVVQAGIDFAAIGRAIIVEPKWVQKVMAGDEASIRYQLCETDLDDLAIPLSMLQYMLSMIPMPFTQKERVESPNKAII